jgi:hypothetical protein
MTVGLEIIWRMSESMENGVADFEYGLLREYFGLAFEWVDYYFT